MRQLFNDSPNKDRARSIDTWLLPTQVTALLIELLADQGVEPEIILLEQGLSLSDLQDDNYWISYRQNMAIIDQAYRLSGNPALGFEVGLAEDLSTLGILGYAMFSCETLGQALDIGVKYHRTAQSLLENRLLLDDASMSIITAPPFAVTAQQHRFAVEELFTGLLRIAQILTGKAVLPARMHCAYSKPAYHERYRQVFQCPIHFNSKETALVFSRDIMDLPVLQANKFNARMSEKLCQSLLVERIGEEGMTGRVRQILVRSLGRFPDETQVADELSMSCRSMRRALADEGGSFRRILDEVRTELAQNYLSHTSMNVDQIASLLGYTEATNFRRAFKRWVGLSPRDYRQSH